MSVAIEGDEEEGREKPKRGKKEERKGRKHVRLGIARAHSASEHEDEAAGVYLPASYSWKCNEEGEEDTGNEVGNDDRPPRKLRVAGIGGCLSDAEGGQDDSAVDPHRDLFVNAHLLAVVGEETSGWHDHDGERSTGQRDRRRRTNEGRCRCGFGRTSRR